ncbi:rab11 family-interacting protein 5 isoform X1 [Falco naumanni]|uniref:rab11 family-interacting protein 5 isoform X1 n=1 Tax=Falco naumanni TaxID=148594 RepID=UPI001ADE5D18|nr:rab11 family-interacting protein 5 isoform X1 [Falco naumanni]
MALLRAAALPAEQSPAWQPTHVQVTVVRARGLRCKGGGKPGTSDAYTIIQLGREKYSTSVAEKSTGNPEWREECAFELPPELGAPAGLARGGLVLTVMHRALVGMDRFLGQALVPLEPALQQGRAPEERWHKLHSKAGKKEKERGEILVSIQFTRNNLTASMFDLSMKDKPRSPFGKLKDKVKGKKKYDLESASAIIPSSMGALDMEDDYDIGGKKSKVKGFFFKNKLRKSSLTQSNTSLGSDSTISSASLGLAANVPEVTKSPSRHSSLSTERSVKDYLPSPKLTHKRAFSDDVSQVSPVLEPKAIQSLKPKNDPVSRSSLCINGNHVYSDEPVPKSPMSVPQSSAPLSVPSIPKRQEEGFGFTPLHSDSHEVPWGVSNFERTPQRDEPRFIPSPPSLALQEELKVSTKAVTLSNHLGRAKMEENSRLENKPTQAAMPIVFSTETTKDKQPEEMRKEDKKAKGGLFHHGGNKSDAGSKGQGEKVGPSHGSSVHVMAGGDERNKSSGWFGSKEPKESPQKPSFPSEPHASTEVAGSFYSSEDCSPSASLRHKDPERESPAKSVCVPVPETTPLSQGDLPSPDKKPAVPPPLSEWDDTFDAFATSRLKPELKKENFFASVAVEGMAFIDDPVAASPTERLAEPTHEKGTKVFEKADPQISREMPSTLRSWTNFSSLDVGANLVSTTQEATVIEDVLSPVSAGSMGGRRKSSTPTVWTAAFASGSPGEKEASASLIAENSAREEGDSNEEEHSSAGTNGWMTIATETAPDLSESTQSVAEQEPVGQDSAFGPRPAFLGEGTFEAKSGPCAAACVLPRSTFTSETLPGSNVVAVPPRVLADVAPRQFPLVPKPGMEPQGAGSEEETFDIRTSIYRLQATMRLEASENRVKLSSDICERHVVLSQWTDTREREEMAAGSAMPPPKPPRWFAAAGGRGDDDEEDACDPQLRQQGSEERREDTEGPKADTEVPRSHLSSEPSVPVSPNPPALGVDIAETRSEFPVSKDAESAATDSAANLEVAADKVAKGDTSLGEDQSEMNEMDVAEQFETCPSKFFLDGLGQSGAKESWSQPGLSPLMGATDSADWDMASKQELFPEELRMSGLNQPSKLDLGQSEIFWTALEEQEAAGHPVGAGSAVRPQRLAHGESPPQLEPAWDDGEGRHEPVAGPTRQAGGQSEPFASMAVVSPPQEAEQGRPPASKPEGPLHQFSADSRIDFKKADFWKPDRVEERHKQDASDSRNPFAPALSPNTPSNPFVEKAPDPLPVEAVLPKKLDQGGFSFTSLHEEALGQGFQSTNLPGDPLSKPPFLHENQPLAFSTPFLVAATNPKQFDFPSPVACPASSGVPAATSRAAAQPCPLPQSGDTQASALVVLPRETQPAEKPFFQQTTSPHPVKPITAAVQEVSSEKKQQHRSSLTTALSNGLEKLKTVTTSSVQPVALSSQPEKTDSKKLKDPTILDQSAKYYHLTHDELIQLLLQREKELSKKEEHIHELENYIDQLLVRIMEQSPTLLQIPLGESKTK